MKITKEKWENLPCNHIQPSGWVREQLKVLATGLTGHLEEIWDDVGPQSAWLGGNGESWERGPYYLDGLIVLAEILQDTTLQEKEMKWVSHVLHSQESDGSFGPKTNEDWWPRMVMMKALLSMADAHQDDPFGNDICNFLQKAVEHMNNSLRQKPLKMWAFARAMETCTTLFWLEGKEQPVVLNSIEKRIEQNGLDWVSFFKDFPIKKPMQEIYPWSRFLTAFGGEKKDSTQPTLLDRTHNKDIFTLYHTSHGVNLAMALKYMAYWYHLTDNKEYLDILNNGFHQLMKYHGQGNGMFGCDEHLSGPEPYQGTELCAVVEMMFSIEEIIRYTHDLSWADELEMITFNALFSTIAPDGCSHQYDQQVNQIGCTVSHHPWYSNHDDANIFGLEPNFGCCTANMHQGWPKFVQNAWMKDSDGYICISYIPLSFQDGNVLISVSGSYPFREDVAIKINGNGKAFSVKLRIPSWANNAYAISLDGKTLTPSNNLIVISQVWHTSEIRITFKYSIRLERTPYGAFFYRGPLLYALPLNIQKHIIADRGQFSDFSLTTTDDWNYGILAEDISQWTVSTKAIMRTNLFSITAPVIHCHGALVSNWEKKDNSAGPIPQAPVWGQNGIKELMLIPYGLTTLHIAAFPLI